MIFPANGFEYYGSGHFPRADSYLKSGNSRILPDNRLFVKSFKKSFARPAHARWTCRRWWYRFSGSHFRKKWYFEEVHDKQLTMLITYGAYYSRFCRQNRKQFENY